MSETRSAIDGHRLTRSGKYFRLYLGLGHPYANSGGWQWAHRYVAMEVLGRRLSTSEQVHHECRNSLCLNPWHLAVVDAEYHGRFHAFGQMVAGGTKEGLAELELHECLSLADVMVNLPRDKWMIGGESAPGSCDRGRVSAAIRANLELEVPF